MSNPKNMTRPLTPMVTNGQGHISISRAVLTALGKLDICARNKVGYQVFSDLIDKQTKSMRQGKYRN